MLFSETLVVLSDLYKLCINSLMLKIYQQTVRNSISFDGVGLHTGKECKINILRVKMIKV